MTSDGELLVAYWWAHFLTPDIADDRPTKRRRTRGAEVGKYVAEMRWKEHWSGGSMDEDVELVTDTASSVKSLFTSIIQTLVKYEDSSAIIPLYVRCTLLAATQS